MHEKRHYVGVGDAFSSHHASYSEAHQPAVLSNPRYWPIWLAMQFAKQLARLPHRHLLALGQFLGAIGYFILLRRRLRATRQIAMCFPEQSSAERKKLVYRNFLAYGIGIFERLMGWWWPSSRLSDVMGTVDGLEHLHQAVARGHGVILLVLHTTTMEIGGALIRQIYPIDATYRVSQNPVYEWVQRQARSRFDRPGRVLDAGDVRSALRTLKAGRVLWYAADRDYHTKACVFAPFFRIPAATVTGASRYARMTGAQVVTLAQWRDRDGRYRLSIGAPLAHFPSDDLVADCTRINAWAEQEIRRYPEQYRWVHKRFKTRPPQLVADPAPSAAAEIWDPIVRPKG